MAAVFEQSNGNDANAYGSTIAVTFDTKATTTGNLLVAMVAWAGSATLTGVTDNKSNTWLPATTGTTDGRGNKAAMYYCGNATGGSSHQVTATFSAGSSAAMAVAEYSGLTTTPLDKAASAVGDSTNWDSGNVATTAQADELLIGGLSYYLNATATLTGDGTWNSREALYDTDESITLRLWDRVVAATGTYSVQGTLPGSQAWNTHIATFREAGGVGVSAVISAATAAVLVPGAAVAYLGSVSTTITL